MTVEDYPSTGHTMPPDEFAALDTQLIWSQAEPQSYQEPSRHGWASTIKVAAAAAVAVLGAIVAAAVTLNPPGHVESTSVTQTVTATIAASPSREADPGPPPGPFVMPTVMAAHETQDGDYLQRVFRSGLVRQWSWPLSPDAQAKTIRFAQSVCSDLARGYTAHQIAVGHTLNYPEEGWSVAENEQWVRIAAAVYCPELS